MFEKGDKIVYPMYGAGIVEEIEEKTISGVTELYYSIDIPNGNMKIMLSTKKAQAVGLRKVDCQENIEQIIHDVAAMPLTVAENWNQRYKDNLQKIKSGKLIEVAEVFRNLMLRDQKRGLSSAEKKMLNSAKQIILSEIIFSHNIEKEKAEELLAKSLFNC